MNIAFFLIPKKDVVCLNIGSTMRQAVERMEYHGYSAVPLLDDAGRYVGTLTEGDLLRKLKNTLFLTFSNMDQIKLGEIGRIKQNEPVRIDAEITDLLSRAATQNFVPVVDDQGIFIGIVRRREILGYFNKIFQAGQEKEGSETDWRKIP
ncbi:MAG: CBS domain-containing protein [Gracilibacteraceae bacterium]|jgi:CBS domain-containing protein|nr:CBS domain-containing protein [Gracilibacteraceae bacterium]